MLTLLHIRIEGDGDIYVDGLGIDYVQDLAFI